MSLFSHCRPPFGASKGTRSIYIMGDATVPWFGPIPPIGRQGTQKRQTNALDDEDAGATATTDVTIAVDNDAATASVEGDKGNHLW